MKHSREDYNRIQDPGKKIPDDEPVFLIRGQDILAPAVLRYYALLCADTGGDPRVVEGARAWAEQMDNWQEKHKRKMPDIPSGIKVASRSATSPAPQPPATGKAGS